MTTYQTKLKSREEIAEGTMAFHLEKPAGFQFQAGQYLDITLINPPETDSQGVVRTFSIASAPYENELLVATRMRNSAFKRVLATIPLRTELKLDGPMGSFTPQELARPAVFLAGGIGITPFSIHSAPSYPGKTLSAPLSLLFQSASRGCCISRRFGDFRQIGCEFHFHSFDERNGEIEAGVAGRARLYQPRNVNTAHLRPARTDLLSRALPPWSPQCDRCSQTQVRRKTISVLRNSPDIDFGLWGQVWFYCRQRRASRL